MAFIALNDTSDSADDVVAPGSEDTARGFVPLADGADEEHQSGFVPLVQSKKRTWGEAAGDTAVDLAKGVVGLGESVVGMGDLVTGNLIGKGLGAIGYEPAQTKEFLSSGYSDSRQDANRQVANAEGFMGKTMSLLANPSAAVGSMVESVPMMLGGAGAARAAAVKMLASRGMVAGSAEAAAFLSSPAVVARLTAIGSAAEGGMTAGNIQEQGRQAGRDYTDTAPAAVAGGALTGLIGFGTSKIPGFKDAEVGAALAGMGSTQRQGLITAGKEIVKGTFKEGVLEELPQSAQEQVFTNLALGKPWDEGVAEAAAQGLVAGAGMGGGMTTYTAGRNALAGSPRPASPESAQNTPRDLTTPGQEATNSAATNTPKVRTADGKAPTEAWPEVRLAELELLSEHRSLTDAEQSEGQGLVQALQSGADLQPNPTQFDDVPAYDMPAPDSASTKPQALTKQGQAANDSEASSTSASGWVAFPAESGTLGIPRSEMPQVKSDHRGALVNFLAARDIASEKEKVPADSLKPTQAEFSPAKVERSQNDTGSDRSVLVSSDGYILDGHHQWVDKLSNQADVNVIRFDAPISELLNAVGEFPSVGRSDGAKTENTAPQDSPGHASTLRNAPRPYWEGFQTGDRVQTPHGTTGTLKISDDKHLAYLVHDKNADGSPNTDGGMFSVTPQEVAKIQQTAPAVQAAPAVATKPPTDFWSFARERGIAPGSLKVGSPEWQAVKNEFEMARAGMAPAPAAPEPRIELQNRDRSRAASVVQMQDIAKNPDYMRLGTSRTPDSGAPMVFSVGDDGRQIPDTSLGHEDMAVMSDGQRVPFVYAVVPAHQVNASNFADGNTNPAYDSKAPGTLKALNNGRTAGLQAAYMRGKAEKYKAELLADVANHGVPAEVINRTLNPMLVRVYRDADNMPGMAAKSQGQGLSMAPGELARQDAPLLDATVLTAYRPGDITSAANRGFVRAFIGKLRHHGQDVAAMMTADGQLSPAGRTRIQAALVQAAYGDSDLVNEMFDSQDSDIKAIGTALKTVAGQWADMRDSARMGAIDAQVDITGNLVQAVNLIRKARQENTALAELAAQQDLLTGQSPDPITVALLRFFYKGDAALSLALGADKVVAKLNAYLQAAMGTSSGAGMFDDAVTVDRILGSINNEATYGQQTKNSGRGTGGSGHPGLDLDAGRQPGDPAGGQGAGGTVAAARAAQKVTQRPEIEQAGSAPAPGDKEGGEGNAPGQKRAGQRSQPDSSPVAVPVNPGTGGQPTANISQAAQEPVKPAKIEDAGQKIGGARKDRWKERGLDLSDLEGMSESEGAELATKANVWKPDYAAMAQATEPVTAAMVKTVYDQLAAQPKKNTPDGRRNYVTMMQAVRQAYLGAKSPEEVKDAGAKLKQDIGIYSTDPVEKAKARELLFSVYKGRSDPFVLSYNELAKAKKLVADGFPEKGEPWKKRLIVRAYGGQGITPAGISSVLKESAELGTPLTSDQIVSGYHRISNKDGQAVGYAASQDDAEAAAKTIYERDLKSGPADKAEPARPHLDTLKRDNLPQRIDRDVSADDFVKDFGFRGVEFGNWAAQDERQRILNMAYDGLRDLADIMGVPPKALSLNGSLGMAFGARGGGKFAAHYEPGKLVINMTKLQGGGSMAHEWAHGLDHYFGELNRPDAYTTAARGASGWYSEEQYKGVPVKRMEQVGKEWKTVEKTRLDNLRPELARAFDQVMSALFSDQETKAQMIRSLELQLERTQALAAREADPQTKAMYERMGRSQTINLEESRQEPEGKTYPKGRSEFAKQAQKLSGKSVNGYWTRPTEMFARAFESWVFDKVAAMGARSDYLVHGVEEDRFAGGQYKGNPYPTGTERATINAALDNLAKTIQTKETEKGVAMFSRTNPDGKSSVLSKNGTFKAWPKFNEWTRAEYNDVVSLLPKAYRDDPHRREPLPTKDRDVLYASVLPELEDLNQELGIPGAFRVDDLGNIICSNNKAPAQAIMGQAVALADKFNLGIYVTNTKMPFMKPLIDRGFTGESGLGGILMREAGTTQAPLPNPSNLTGQRVPGIVMSYKPRGFNYALFSRTNPADDAGLEHNALQALSQSDELFALPKSDKDTIEGVAADTDPGITVKKLNHPGLVQTYVLTLPNGARAKLMVRQANPYGPQTYGLLDRDDVDMEIITERPGENAESVTPATEDVYVDVSELKEGGQGAKIYNIAATFAHNTGRILIGDPAGLSDEAMRRRTEHMLSSALKFGTTRHLAPHPRQTMGAYGIGVPPMKWTYGDDLGNIKSLIQTSLKSLDHAGPQLLTFDLPTGTFRDSAGRVLDGDSIRSTVESGRRPEGGAGITTYKRSAVLTALVREEGGKGSTGGQGAGVLAQLVDVGREFPAPSKGIFYSKGRGASGSGLTAQQINGIVDAIQARWANAPDVVVAESMDDPAIPKAVRDEDAKQRSQGASGTPEGFFYGGKVYLVADQLATPTDAMRVLFHEALGHMGLRGVFGDSLKPILQQIILARRQEVATKAQQYGLDMTNPADALAAAEEVLAGMAQDKPELGFVKRAIAAIRTWLRANVPGFKDMHLSDAEIITSYILPARAFVQGGQGRADGALSFSRGIQTGTAAFKAWFGDSKVVDKDGQPLVVYHGTSADEQGDAFTSFDTYASNYGLMGMGGYFTADPGVASSYTTKGRGSSPSVYPVFLSIKTPLDMDAMADAAAWTGQFDDIETFHDGGTTNESWYRAAEDMLTDQEIPKYEGAEIMQDGLRAMGFDGITHVGGGRVKADGIRHRVFIAFDPEQIKSATGNNGNFDGTKPDIRFSRNSLGNKPIPPVTGAQANAWTMAKAKVMRLTSPEVLEKLIYEFQDKFIDLKNLRAHITELGGTITDLNDAYQGEELYHSRLAKRTADFLDKELKPLLADMRNRGVNKEQLENYLHARHAPEANAAMAERNPTRQMIDDGRAKATKDVKELELKLQHARNNHSATKAIEDALIEARGELAKWHGAQAFKGTEAARTSLSGMSDIDAKAYMDSLAPRQLENLKELATSVDAIQAETLDTLAHYGLMDRASLTAWRKAYQHYVPLHRDEARPETGSHPIGQGFSVKGNASKQRTGSTEKVTNILAHIAMQREAALTRGEKNHVVKKLYLMAAQNPDKEFWEVDAPPMIKTIDSRTGFVRTMVDPQFKNLPNVVMVRIAGNDQAIVFNENNKQAKRLAEAIKNIDVGDLHVVLGLAAKGTRWFASINTQYNPIFGLVNFARDVQSGLLNLSTTPLAGKQKEVTANIPAAMRAIYRERRGKSAASIEWARLWDEYQSVGGITGYKDMFADVEDRAKALTKELDALDRGEVSKAAHAVVDWLSHYNEAMENSVRLAAYKQALDQGISKERAASLAKNLTVNFNRKGRQAREIGALFAFFNASIQGTARMAETLKGPVGKRVMCGGVLLGVVNTLIGMAMMGGDDDDDAWEQIPEFIKERSIVIPIGHQDYLTIPMPLGFHVFPNIGRIATEFALGGQDKTLGRQLGKLLMATMDSFNPLGGSQNLGQLVSPTVIDPVVALMENRDWTGKPIYRENANGLDPQPGHTMAKDSASSPSRWFAEAINNITGGTQYRPGAWSPTPDQLDYVIGQLTGGLGRELLKANQTVVSAATGDELPPYKVPLLGRLYGNTRGPSGQSGQYYANVKDLNEIENELIGRELHNEDVDGYRKTEPLADLIELGNDSERQIREDRKARRAVVQSARPGYQDQVRELDTNIGAVMTNLNREVTKARRKAEEKP